MFFTNYISKILFGKSISYDLITFFKLVINSKRYSSKYKTGTIALENDETILYHFNFHNKNFDFKLRTYKGDFDIFYEIFWKKVYDTQDLPSEPKIILDLGAHIGLTSVFYSLKYPLAKIISVEPSAENFDILKFNTKSFTNISCLSAAVYYKDDTINFGNNEFSYNQRISDQGPEVSALSVDSIFKKFDLTHIDLLKIDIEGAEIELLSKNNQWLRAVDQIIIEIHKPYTLKELEKDLRDFDFTVIPLEVATNILIAKKIQQ